MKKFLLTSITAILLCLSMAGCSGGNVPVDPSTSDTSVQQEKTTTSKENNDKPKDIEKTSSDKAKTDVTSKDAK